MFFLPEKLFFISISYLKKSEEAGQAKRKKQNNSFNKRSWVGFVHVFLAQTTSHATSKCQTVIKRANAKILEEHPQTSDLSNVSSTVQTQSCFFCLQMSKGYQTCQHEDCRGTSIDEPNCQAAVKRINAMMREEHPQTSELSNVSTRRCPIPWTSPSHLVDLLLPAWSTL